MSEMKEERGPFSLGELSSLGQARETDDVGYLKSWSRAAVRRYESEKNRLMGELEKALKRIESLENVDMNLRWYRIMLSKAMHIPADEQIDERKWALVYRKKDVDDLIESIDALRRTSA